MYEQLGFEQSRVSHNLGCLLHCGFMQWRRQRKNKVYSLNPGLRPVLEGIDRHIEQYARQLDACRVLEGEGRPVVVLAARARPQQCSQEDGRQDNQTDGNREHGLNVPVSLLPWTIESFGQLRASNVGGAVPFRMPRRGTRCFY